MTRSDRDTFASAVATILAELTNAGVEWCEIGTDDSGNDIDAANRALARFNEVFPRQVDEAAKAA